MFKRLWLLVFVVTLMLSTMSFAKQVTVNTGDLPFDTAKTILLSTGDRSFNGLADDALRQVLQNKVTLTFDDGLLPTDLRAKLDAAQKMATVTSTLNTGKDWAEAGQAIGIATRGALSALTDETEKFAKTTPGIFLMAVVAWKVAGADFLNTIKGYLIGVPLLIFWCSLFVWYLRRVYGIHHVTRYVDAEGGKKVKVREEVPPLSVTWNKDWAEQCAKSHEPDKMGTNEMAMWGAVKTAGFVIVIFVIMWLVI